MIAIIDYGMGNLGSIFNMLKKIGSQSIITSDIELIRNANKIILPGVGSFDTAIKKIDELGLRNIILEIALDMKKPLLGICLGMQLLMQGSDEGSLPGLGLVKGRAHHFRNHLSKEFKIPHMGWNDIRVNNITKLTQGFNEEIRFYFVHSYFVHVKNEHNSMMKCFYGIDFDAAIQNENILGVQFHPEKSHKYGIQLFRNFVAL
ncbi:imidazole glycerol phosphate synthase subunit HisH [Bacteroidota bacterium]